MEQGHLYFYDTYNSNLKIAYTVWESTLLGDGFFRKLLEFDYLWVVSQWHKDCVVKQGYPENRVFVVNEGVNSEFFKDKEKLSHLEELHDDSFNFLFFGRWDYRKFVPEIISSFLEAFPNGEKVNLILSADNLYPVDGLNSTEERLKHYGFNDPRIKVKHFLKRDEYVSYVKNSNVMITCARSEGWNIPLIESLAAGTPVIYSNWGAQLEFASGLGTPVRIQAELPAKNGEYYGWGGEVHGLYAEPDNRDLTLKIRECYDNWEEKKEKALEDSKIIIEKFNWENIGKSGYETIKMLN
jgi:glycosyltransferase involved in cell wall biosynthesis